MKPVAPIAQICSIDKRSAGRVKSLMLANTKPHLHIGAQKKLVKEEEAIKLSHELNN